MALMVPQDKTFIIAEIGINHDGDFQTAKNMIYAAKESGADAVKFQTYLLDERTNPSSKYYELFKKCCLTYDQFAELKEYSDAIGIEFFSTPFGTTSLNFLMGLGTQRIKIASFDVTNTKLLDDISNWCLNVPQANVIMSVGMANRLEVMTALEHLKTVSSISLLHCVSSYPTPEEEAGLLAIKSLSLIGSSKITRVGYSDHTSGIRVPALAVLVGATVIEKHFTLDKDNGAVDNPVSASPGDMRDMVTLIRSYEELLGSGSIEMKEIEKAATVFRRTT